ncbi:hypothetical protein RMI87_15920 [Pseudomonas aeruginosa]|uniref:hypothetical protein n=1 Tax=Pseudomonas aeruginosa TaxID=287 RepID=UPI00287E9C9D|nr:hypothetical protein [Pseudomonas aeruginosa]MDS9914992.1 hypothetical protein [Pseudomonas aeruginosa]
MKREFMTALAISVATGAHAGLQEDIAAKEAAVAELRQTVEPLVAPLVIEGRDVRVFASLSPLVDAMSELANRPAGERTLHMRSTDRNGEFWKNGGTWCGSYVQLDHADSMKATAVLSNMKGSVAQDGSLLLASRATIDGKVQLKFQFKGRRVNIIVGNACPPGGGVGTSIGVDFDKTIDLNLAVGFKQAPDGRSLSYSAAFTNPDKVSVTAEIGLGPIGKIGHPMSFDIPKSPIASGTFPLLIANEGTFKLPAGAGERAYIFALNPVSFSSTQQGIQASWKSAVQFKEQTYASSN